MAFVPSDPSLFVGALVHRKETESSKLRLFKMGAMSLPSDEIPQTQTVALVRELGGSVEFREGYPVPTPGPNEVLAKVLYTGVCQSGQS